MDDQARSALEVAGVKARDLRVRNRRLAETVEGLSAALAELQRRAADPSDDPAATLARLSEDAGRALTLAIVHEGTPSDV